MGRFFVGLLVAAGVVAFARRETVDDWFPMRAGDRWTYRDVWHRRDVVFEVVGEEDDVFRVERRIQGETIEFRLSVDSRGVWLHRTSVGEFTPPFEQFRLPPRAGEAWSHSGRFGAWEVDIHSRVVSRAKDRCEIEERASHAGETMYTLEKGKGVVALGGKARDPHRKDGGGDAWRWELTSFERRR